MKEAEYERKKRAALKNDNSSDRKKKYLSDHAKR